MPYRVNKRSKGFFFSCSNRSHKEGNVDAVLSILNPLSSVDIRFWVARWTLINCFSPLIKYILSLISSISDRLPFFHYSKYPTLVVGLITAISAARQSIISLISRHIKSTCPAKKVVTPFLQLLRATVF